MITQQQINRLVLHDSRQQIHQSFRNRTLILALPTLTMYHHLYHRPLHFMSVPSPLPASLPLTHLERSSCSVPQLHGSIAAPHRQQAITAVHTPNRTPLRRRPGRPVLLPRRRAGHRTASAPHPSVGPPRRRRRRSRVLTRLSCRQEPGEVVGRVGGGRRRAGPVGEGEVHGGGETVGRVARLGELGRGETLGELFQRPLTLWQGQTNIYCKAVSEFFF